MSNRSSTMSHYTIISNVVFEDSIISWSKWIHISVYLRGGKTSYSFFN
jgi:predicted membrane-bound dolichyl-phosphate-mannose-protein mannosyltransferase